MVSIPSPRTPRARESRNDAPRRRGRTAHAKDGIEVQFDVVFGQLDELVHHLAATVDIGAAPGLFESGGFVRHQVGQVDKPGHSQRSQRSRPALPDSLPETQPSTARSLSIQSSDAQNGMSICGRGVPVTPGRGRTARDVAQAVRPARRPSVSLRPASRTPSHLFRPASRRRAQSGLRTRQEALNVLAVEDDDEGASQTGVDGIGRRQEPAAASPMSTAVASTRRRWTLLTCSA